jgi:hypothetical protein
VSRPDEAVPELFWEPGERLLTDSHLSRFAELVAVDHGAPRDNYAALWQWSVEPACNLGAVDDPEAVRWFAELAEQQRRTRTGSGGR